MSDGGAHRGGCCVEYLGRFRRNPSDCAIDSAEQDAENDNAHDLKVDVEESVQKYLDKQSAKENKRAACRKAAGAQKEVAGTARKRDTLQAAGAQKELTGTARTRGTLQHSTESTSDTFSVAQKQGCATRHPEGEKCTTGLVTVHADKVVPANADKGTSRIDGGTKFKRCELHQLRHEQDVD